MSSAKDRALDNMRREDRRILKVRYCEVMVVYPHRTPYEGDKDFNVCDVKLRDLEQTITGEYNIYYKRTNVLQRDLGHLWGRVWTPRVGDLVVVMFMENEKALVLGTIPSQFQEPPCRPKCEGCSDECAAMVYDYLFKWCRWKKPEQDKKLNWHTHPKPDHPDCWKGFHDTRDWMRVLDCAVGHLDPWCKTCTSLDAIQRDCTWWKEFSDETDTILDKPDRIKFHHLCGSTYFFDADGTIYIENRVGEDPRGHVKFWPSGSIEIQSASKESGEVCGLNDDDGSCVWPGARHIVEDDGAVESRNLVNPSFIKIYSSGKIRLERSGGYIQIDENGKITMSSKQLASFVADNGVDIDGCHIEDGEAARALVAEVAEGLAGTTGVGVSVGGTEQIGVDADTTHIRKILNIGDIITPCGSGPTSLRMGDTSNSQYMYIGQANDRNMGFGWQYNIDPALAKALIFTYGQANPLQFQVSLIDIYNATRPIIQFTGPGTFRITSVHETGATRIGFAGGDNSWLAYCEWAGGALGEHLYHIIGTHLVDRNVGIGTAVFGTNADKVIAIGNGVIPASSPADSVQVYAEDDAGSSELKVRDEAGNITVLSPHSFPLFDQPDKMAWSYQSTNPYLGKMINVDMYGAVRAIEKQTGKQFIYLKDLPLEECEDEDAQRLEERICKLVQEDVEIPSGEAIESIEETVETVSDKNETVYELDDQKGEIVSKQIPVKVQKGTGKFKTQLKTGITLDEKTGKCYRKKTRNEAEQEMKLCPSET